MLIFQRIISAILTFGMMLFGVVIGANDFDTIGKYNKNVKSVDIYENTTDTALPQTDVYGLIKNHFESPLPEGKTEKKVIVLGYDGCRADTLTLLGDEAESGIMTLVNGGGNAVLSYCGGVNYPAFNKQATSTAPGWCSMLTGEWADVHGVTDNGIPKSNDHLSLLTTLVEDKTIDDSAFYVSWGGHFNAEDCTYYNERMYCEEKNLPVTFKCNSGDNGTFESVMSDIGSADCSDFIFSIFEYCDHVGHDTGFGLGNEDYCKAFADAEKSAKTCIETIKARETYDTEDWLIIITSDHGGYNLAHGFVTIQERMTFIVTNKDVIK